MTFYGTFGEWEKAQLWLNRTISDKRSGRRQYEKFWVRFYSLIIYYELDMNDFDIHVQSVQKYLQRNNGYSDIAKKITYKILEVYSAGYKKERLVLWKELYTILQDESILVDRFSIPLEELKQWCKSKIEGVSIAEIVRR